jgi:hypothetical protein
MLRIQAEGMRASMCDVSVWPTGLEYNQRRTFKFSADVLPLFDTSS